jgi:hypothetical protein
MPVIQAMAGGIKQEDVNPGQPGQKARPYPQNNQSQKDWGHGSSSRVRGSKCKALSLNPSTGKKVFKNFNPQNFMLMIFVGRVFGR